MDVSETADSHVVGACMQFFLRRWRGQVNSRALLLWDILAIGTALNVFVGFLALLALASDRTSLAVVTHFLLVPYNVFLMVCYWRTPKRSSVGLTTAGIWFALMTIM